MLVDGVRECVVVVWGLRRGRAVSGLGRGRVVWCGVLGRRGA